MTLHDYLLKNLSQTVMIQITVNDVTKQYNAWNWFHQEGQLHFINDDGTIGHIIHGGIVSENNDGSITLSSKYCPKNCVLNFYFGGFRN